MRTAAVQPIQMFKRYTTLFLCRHPALSRNLISLHQQSTNNKLSTPFASKKVDLRQGSLKCPHPSPFVQQEAAAELQKLHHLQTRQPTPSQHPPPLHRKATIETAISVWSAGFVKTNCGHSSSLSPRVSSCTRHVTDT